MKKFVIWWVLFWVISLSKANALEEDNFYTLFSQIPQQSMEDITVSNVAINILKSIYVLDKNLRVGDDNNKISLYYNTRLVKSLYKPTDRNDAKKWADLAGEILNLAIKVSPKAQKYDFEALDRMLTKSVANMGKDAKYFSDGNGEERVKHKLNFAARMEEENLYIKIGVLNKYTKDELLNAINDNKSAKGIILDLRDSPGGQLAAAVSVADIFLEQGVVASVKGKDPYKVVYYNSADGDIGEDFPLVILVDGNTASAAEVLAAAMQDQGRAVVVGTKTYGKGSVQNLIRLAGGGVMSVTGAYFYTPSGRKIAGQGIVPDICTFEMPEYKDENRLIKAPKNDNCLSESRKDSLLDEKIAQILLKNK